MDSIPALSRVLPAERTSARRRALLAAEFGLLFIGGPLVVLAAHSALLLFGSLWLGAILTWLRAPVRRCPRREIKAGLAAIARRFAVLAPLIALLSLGLWPGHFLDLPLQRPRFWLLVMALYPLLSVWPQEMLYRAFLFSRYGALFGSPGRMVAASALSFGFAHVIFLNGVAVFLTVIGGFLFARDYARYRSMLLAFTEHSLYGCLVFTVGLGRFFYTGAAWHDP